LARLKCGWRRDSFACTAGRYSARMGLWATTRGRSLDRRMIARIAATWGENRCPEHNKDSGQSLATCCCCTPCYSRVHTETKLAARVPVRKGTEVVLIVSARYFAEITLEQLPHHGNGPFV